MTKILKQSILIIIILYLFIPLIQKEFPFFKEKPLKGVFILTAKPDSMLKNRFSGEYQNQYEKHFNDSLGFRPFFVRLNNQINFSLFNTILITIFLLLYSFLNLHFFSFSVNQLAFYLLHFLYFQDI